MKINTCLAAILLIISYLKIASQPATHIVKENEALRIEGNDSWISFYRGNIIDGFLQNYHGNIYLGSMGSGDLGFYTAGTPRMTIKGNLIGIGTSSPLYKMHVEAYSRAIYGKSDSEFGIYGHSENLVGVFGYSNASNSAGINGQSAYIGVQGLTNSNSSDVDRQAIRGENYGSSTGWAGYFSGNVGVSGTLSKGAGSFKIDHPLDPENKYLYHSFVESPDMKNLYDGIITTDEKGEAEVILPDWFMTLNKDFRYQLTVINQFAQAIIAQKIENNRFRIKSNLPNVEVSWMITGIRQDPYAEQHRIPVEENKPATAVGKYLHPDVYGQPMEKAVDYQKPILKK
ncbi:MAG: hypothetical protein IPL46_17500 [Saprospiraceae bacterium]|nr:hypothetical protein [Saprospiraceae bacterium]